MSGSIPCFYSGRVEAVRAEFLSTAARKMGLNTVIRKKGGVYSFVELSLIVSFHTLVNYELFVKKKKIAAAYIT